MKRILSPARRSDGEPKIIEKRLSPHESCNAPPPKLPVRTTLRAPFLNGTYEYEYTFHYTSGADLQPEHARCYFLYASSSKLLPVRHNDMYARSRDLRLPTVWCFFFVALASGNSTRAHWLLSGETRVSVTRSY